MELLRCEHLTKRYGSGENAVCAVNDVSFAVNRGEFVAILGASGSGKSTLLHLLGAVDAPTSGEVTLDGTRLCACSEEQKALLRRRKIGFVFQEYNLVPVLTAEENILLPLSLDGKAPDAEYLGELLRVFGLENRRSFLPSRLSGGQKQRVAAARALITRPAILFADEPTGNLDSENSGALIDLFCGCVGEFNQTLVLVTHSREIADRADRVLFMKDGRISEGAQ